MFEIGMKLETINPNNRMEICPATVIQTFPSGHFSIQVDSISGSEMPPIRVCSPGDPYIFPTGKSRCLLLHKRKFNIFYLRLEQNVQYSTDTPKWLGDRERKF